MYLLPSHTEFCEDACIYIYIHANVKVCLILTTNFTDVRYIQLFRTSIYDTLVYYHRCYYYLSP